MICVERHASRRLDAPKSGQCNAADVAAIRPQMLASVQNLSLDIDLRAAALARLGLASILRIHLSVLEGVTHIVRASRWFRRRQSLYRYHALVTNPEGLHLPPQPVFVTYVHNRTTACCASNGASDTVRGVQSALWAGSRRSVASHHRCCRAQQGAATAVAPERHSAHRHVQFYAHDQSQYRLSLVPH